MVVAYLAGEIKTFNGLLGLEIVSVWGGVVSNWPLAAFSVRS